MANNALFNTSTQNTSAGARNEAGGQAYRLPPKHALAQLAATGCFNGTYYGTDSAQLDALLSLASQIDDNHFIAKLAVYARERAMMKDMPAALVALLAKRDTELMHRVFDRVIDNGRMLRTLFQMIRSGKFGKKSLSYSLQRAFQRWLNNASVGQLLSASIGHSPSLRDVLRLARPTPKDHARRALFGWLVGKDSVNWAPASASDLPEEISVLGWYRQAESEAEQVEWLDRLKVRWDLLADAALGRETWKAITHQMGPQALRMNLNTLLRHGVIGPEGDSGLTAEIASRLADPDEIRRSRQFPYQFLSAYLNADEQVPGAIRDSLVRAAEVACGNVPELPGPIVVGVDVSGSMQSPVTGYRGRGATSKVRCVDVAALFAAAVLRRNPNSVVIPFDHRAHEATGERDESILDLSARLARYGGGGTDCSLPLATANRRYRRPFAGCVLISDNESWIGTGRYGATATVNEWDRFAEAQRRRGVAEPKLICIDLQPYGTVQAPDRDDILNVGGFSDAVFGVVASFLSDEPGRFVTEVETIEV